MIDRLLRDGDENNATKRKRSERKVSVEINSGPPMKQAQEIA
jgi:hypothetical protein